MLTYTSDALDEPLRVVGPVKAVLHAPSSAPDTDWVVRLCDVWPDGRSVDICDGTLRARYRESFEREALLNQGRSTVSMWTCLLQHMRSFQVTVCGSMSQVAISRGTTRISTLADRLGTRYGASCDQYGVP